MSALSKRDEKGKTSSSIPKKTEFNPIEANRVRKNRWYLKRNMKTIFSIPYIQAELFPEKLGHAHYTRRNIRLP